MGFFEIEQKYRLKDPGRMRAALKKMGARKIASGVEVNEFYDRDDFLKKQKAALRLRRFGGGRAILTLKGPRLRSKFTKRMEVETLIEYPVARKLLRFLKCRVQRRYSKKRELYKLGKTAVTVDFLKKFGWFLEIEGQIPVIKRLERILGLTREDREERSYLQMLFQWKH